MATAVVLALPAVLGSPILDTRQNGVTCQTSSGSPKTGDVTAVINQLNGKGGNCPNTNDKASGKFFFRFPGLLKIMSSKAANYIRSDCTTLAKSGSAAISICGGEDDDSSQTTCADVAGFANQIQQTCLSGNLVGGTYTISPATRVEVIDTSSV